MAEFAQPPATREVMAEQARNLLDQQITTDNAITLAVGILSRSELARAILAANPKPIKYSSALRCVERWFTGAAETRKPSKASRAQVAEVLKGNQRALAQLFPQGVRMRLNATLVIGGYPSYSRRRTGISWTLRRRRRLICLCRLRKTLMKPGKLFSMYVYVRQGRLNSREFNSRRADGCSLGNGFRIVCMWLVYVSNRWQLCHSSSVFKLL